MGKTNLSVTNNTLSLYQFNVAKKTKNMAKVLPAEILLWSPLPPWHLAIVFVIATPR